jgi:ABC-type transport system involved in cytochrome bd biosynthesis fused ATPase/permease subunit
MSPEYDSMCKSKTLTKSRRTTDKQKATVVSKENEQESIPENQVLINHPTDPPTATTMITVRIQAPARSPVLMGSSASGASSSWVSI